MNFASLEFGAFLIIVLIVRLYFQNSRSRIYIVILVFMSLFFYGWAEPTYVLIVLASTAIDFCCGLAIERYRSSKPIGRLLVTLSCVSNLGILGFFKYSGFFASNLQTHLGVDDSLIATLAAITLPIGISFYTFQSMAYTIDVFRGERPVRNPINFLFYISFFPQLVAGPIVRAHNFFYQLGRARRVRLQVWLEGCRLIILGFFLKLVVADNIGLALDGERSGNDGLWFLASQLNESSTYAWLAMALFSAQIFCDFAGYTNIARGVAYLLGFRLPINFNAPYIAATFSEFWTRWHITLSRWLRDYLYIPLGGNRISPANTYLNLMAVMLLGGLWHGAGWTFVAWGAIHGLALVIERLLGMSTRVGESFLTRLGWYMIVQTIVLVAWVYFRSESFETANAILANALQFDFQPIARLWDLINLQAALTVVWVVPILHLRACLRETGLRWLRETRTEQAIVSGFLLIATLAYYGEGSQFIYFQF